MADTTYWNEPVSIYFASPPPDAGHWAEAARSLARNLTETEEAS